jgi:hypothetical protein
MNNTPMTKKQTKSVVIDIWQSFQSLPLWVRVWVAGILMPINIASLFFLSEPMGMWVAVLANFAMLPNLPLMVYERGLSKGMALPHLLPWSILVALILYDAPDPASQYGMYLWALAGINSLSLLFDFPDAIKWLKGDRAVASDEN